MPAPKCESIRFIQIANVLDTRTGEDFVWGGGDANRENIKTDEKEGRLVRSEGGWFVDIITSDCDARKMGNMPCPIYYHGDRTRHPAERDGSNTGASDPTFALMQDFPQSFLRTQWRFETCVVCADGGKNEPIGCLSWGFDIYYAAEIATVFDFANPKPEPHSHPSVNFYAAIAKFNQFYVDFERN